MTHYTQKRSAASLEIFNIRDKLTSQTYVQLMDMLAGKRDEVDVTNAKYVAIACDQYYTYFDEDEDQPVVCEMHKTKLFEITDCDGLCRCDNNDFMSFMGVQLTRGFLKTIADSYKNDKCLKSGGELYRIKAIDVLHRESQPKAKKVKTTASFE